MAFTSVTLTGNFGSSATGQLTFTLSRPMSNGTALAIPQPIIAQLSSGQLSQALDATTDPDTVPQGVVWGVTEQVDGAQPRDYFIVVPAPQTETNGSTTDQSAIVQLSTVTPELWMVGLPISGTNIPSNTTITAVNQALQQVTLSDNATGTGTGLSITIGSTTIDISALMPGETEWQ